MFTGKQILAVDDSMSICSYLRTILTRYGAVVAIANTGQAGLDAVRQQKYDLILLDLMLPGEVLALREHIPPTPTPTPLPEPKAYSGSGSDVVAIEKPGGLDAVVIVHVVGNAESSYFGVTGFDEAGKQTDLLVNTTDPYDGITLLDARKGQTTTRLQVEAQGDWTIEVRPLAMARAAAVPGTTSGAGDDVLLLDGEPDTAHIVGNAEGRYFGVIGHGKRYDLLVNTTDPYDGRVIVNRDTVVIEVKATGEWEVTFE